MDYRGKSKAINWGKVLLISALTLSTIGSYAKDGKEEKKKAKTDCSLGLNIPDRLVTIARDENEVVFRDDKSHALLTFTKVGLAAYDFDLETNAHQMFKEIEENPEFEGLDIRRKDLSVTDCFILRWKSSTSGPNKKNDYSTMALIEVCGQYYNFTFDMPSKKANEVLPLFSQILESVDQVDN